MECDTKRLLKNRFRVNPRLRLVELAEEDREASVAGVLYPNDSTESETITICSDTVALWKAVDESGALPQYAHTAESGGNHSISRLVLDGLLEMADDSGEFHSGPAALQMLFPTPLDLERGGRLGRLSLAALRYAAALGAVDNPTLTWKLYSYNSRPATAEYRRRFVDRASVRRYLGLGLEAKSLSGLERNWRESATPDNPAWIIWQSREAQPFVSGSPIFKLYVSPRVERLRDVFQTIVTTGVDLPIPQFKVGANLAGVLRPDKLVIYFSDRESLLASHEALAQALQGCEAQGVPFSAELSGDGLFSWGLDPPSESSETDGAAHFSWRYWVANSLAKYLQVGSAASSKECDPLQFALRRMQLEGVEIETWTPAADIWDEPLNLGEKE